MYQIDLQMTYRLLRDDLNLLLANITFRYYLQMLRLLQKSAWIYCLHYKDCFQKLILKAVCKKIALKYYLLRFLVRKKLLSEIAVNDLQILQKIHTHGHGFFKILFITRKEKLAFANYEFQKSLAMSISKKLYWSLA